MFTVRLATGKILSEHFLYPQLDEVWSVHGDASQYNLTEKTGVLKLFHGPRDISILTEEPEDSYVIDIQNTYTPTQDGDVGGILVYKDKEEFLEFLEYFDSEKNSSFIYKFMRIVRLGKLYSAYGRNVDTSEWEFIGSVSLNGQGVVGVTLKGDNLPDYTEFHVNEIQIYKSQTIQFININPGQKVRMYNEDGRLLSSQICKPGYSGVVLNFTEKPPYNVYFELCSEDGKVIHTTDIFSAYGGDVYYYGAKLQVFVNDERLNNDEPYFLGHYEDNVIYFDIKLVNPYDVTFSNLSLKAMQYKTSNGYQNVSFSLTGDTYEKSIEIPDMGPQDEVFVKAKIERDVSLEGVSYEPFKFFLKISQGDES